MSPKVAIIFNAYYDDIIQLAEQEAKGVRALGGTCDLFQLTNSHGNYPVATNETLSNYDAFLFGVSSRFGNFPSPWRMLFDGTGALWAGGNLYHKACGIFVSTNSSNAGQEGVVTTTLSTLTHHGMLFIPLGYKPVVKELTNFENPHGGSPWGAGTFNNNGSRSPNEVELKTAYYQGKSFYNSISNAASRSQTV